MEKRTRVQKYKNLRESMKEEVSINRNAVVDQQDEEDDFLSFLPKEEKVPTIEDTLEQPLSYESLDELSDDVQDVLNMAKRNVGKSQYNTRLDILNKIKNEEKKELEADDLENGHVVNGAKKMSLLEKLAAMSPEEDVEELEMYEKEKDVKPVIKEEKKVVEKEVQKPVKKTADIELISDLIEKEEQIIEADDVEFEEESGDKLVTALNIIILILLIVFIFFIGMFVKQLFF